jgi:dsDNA-specific endonuclease/ATPase MutS2
MLKKLRENLNLNELLALIEAPGELGSAIKRHKLAARPELEELKKQYHNTSWFRDKLQGDKTLKDKLDEFFNHLPLLALDHFKRSPCLEMHEFFELKSFLWAYGRLRNLVLEMHGAKLHSLPNLEKLFQLLDPEGNGLPAFRISPLYDKKLLHYSESRSDYAHQLKLENAAYLEQAREKLNNPSLKEEFILPRSKSDLIAILQHSKFFVVRSESMSNLSFRLADSAKAMRYKNKISRLNMEIEEAEKKVLCKLTSQLSKYFAKLETALKSCAELAWEFSLALFAINYACCIPKLGSKLDTIKLRSAVNLPLKLALENRNRHYQSLDFDITRNSNLITGPNMGGKTTALITLGQLCHLAAWGIPLPAKQAELPVFDEIYYNHDSGEGSETLSSFGREVVSFVQMISRKGHKLILLDEFARGTNPEEGEKLCLAVLNYLAKSGQIFVAATHFSAPANLQSLAHFSIKGISEAELEALEGTAKDDLEQRLKHLSEVMDYSLIRLKENQTPPQCALRIAAILGLPKEILQVGHED